MDDKIDIEKQENIELFKEKKDIESNQNNSNCLVIGESNNQQQKTFEKNLIIENVIYVIILMICSGILYISKVLERPFFERDPMESFVPNIPNQVIISFVIFFVISLINILHFHFLFLGTCSLFYCFFRGFTNISITNLYFFTR
jgi:hypothetical protein